MTILRVVVTLVLAAVLGYAAIRKLSHRRDVVESYARVGVPENRLNLLAAILIGGALGLVLGLFWRPPGIAAGIGLVLYFLLAIGAHVRAKDARNLPTPVLLLALSAATLALSAT